MDFRQLLNKLDTVALSEAITLKDVEAAVSGIKDEQERAAKLNDLAWDNKLPGLYDPVSGYFVGKQSQPSSMGGRYNISATASSSADKQLADLGLVPQNAKTSTALGRMFRGDDKGQYDADVKGKSATLVKQQEFDKRKSEELPKFKQLVDKLKSLIGNTNQGSASQNAPGVSPEVSKAQGVQYTESIFNSLIKEFQEIVIDPKFKLYEAISPEIQAVIDQIEDSYGSLETLSDDPEVKQAIDDAKSMIADYKKSEEEKYNANMDKELDAASAEADKVAADTKAAADAKTADAEKKADTAKAGGNKVLQIQQQLKALGVDVGTVDGKMGPKTIAGIKAFQQMAGIAADGKVGPQTEKALADGKNIVARSQLTQSLAAIEAIVNKYKISESVTEEDVLAMTEDEARSFVMKNIKFFGESEQIAIMRDFLSEAPVPAVAGSNVPVPAPGGAGGGRRTIDMGKADVVDVKPKQLPAPAAGAKPSWGQRALNFVKGLNPKKAVAGAIAAGALTLGALWKSFSGGNIEMDPADLAELQKHLKVLDQYGQDPAVKTGLPADVQKRLDSVMSKLDKLRKAKAKGGDSKPAAGAPQAASGMTSLPPAA